MRKQILGAVMGAMLIAGSATSAYAAGYTDIQKHWAKDYIESITEHKLISGYDNGTFKPDADVTRIEAIIMTCNLFKPELIDSVFEEHGSKWIDKLKANNIPDWSWKYMVFALENNIIPNTDTMLASLMSKTNKNVQIKAPKYEAVVFLVNALGWKDEKGTAIVLKYKDTNDIHPQAIPYIDILIRKKIIGETGDNQGNFGANRGVTRAEMAVMLANSYQYSQKATGVTTVVTNPQGDNKEIIKETNPTTTPPTAGAVAVQNEDYKVVDGTIKLITSVGDSTSIVIADSTGAYKSYINKTNEIQVKVENLPAKISDIKINDKVRVLVTSGDMVDSIILEDRQVVKGTLSGISNVTSIQVKSATGVQEYILDPAVKVTIDGILSTLNQVRTDDQLNLIIANGRVTEVMVTPMTAAGTSTISRLTGENRLRNVVIKELQIGSITSRLVVEDSQGKVYALTVDGSTAIRQNGTRDRLDNMRVGYLVEVFTIDNLATEVNSYGEYKISKLDGTVVSVNDQTRIMELKLDSGNQNTIKVYYGNRTTVQDLKGYSINPSKIYKGDKITVIGTDVSDGIDASTIIVDLQYL